MPKPKLLLHLEGAAVLVAACALYDHVHASWWWFLALFLVPDFSMMGYFAGERLGALSYNLVHTYTAPLALLVLLRVFNHSDYAWLGFIWLAHLGWDRLVGYGLKYETAFKDTHLQRI